MKASSVMSEVRYRTSSSTLLSLIIACSLTALTMASVQSQSSIVSSVKIPGNRPTMVPIPYSFMRYIRPKVNYLNTKSSQSQFDSQQPQPSDTDNRMRNLSACHFHWAPTICNKRINDLLWALSKESSNKVHRSYGSQPMQFQRPASNGGRVQYFDTLGGMALGKRAAKQFYSTRPTKPKFNYYRMWSRAF